MDGAELSWVGLSDLGWNELGCTEVKPIRWAELDQEGSGGSSESARIRQTDRQTDRQTETNTDTDQKDQAALA